MNHLAWKKKISGLFLTRGLFEHLKARETRTLLRVSAGSLSETAALFSARSLLWVLFARKRTQKAFLACGVDSTWEQVSVQLADEPGVPLISRVLWTRTHTRHTHHVHGFVCLTSLLHTSEALFWMLTTVRPLHTFKTITANTFASLSAGAWTCAHCLFSKPSRRERNEGKVARFCSLTGFGGSTPCGLYIIKTISYITTSRKKESVFTP